MDELLRDYLPVIVVAALLAAVLLFFLLRPRQRVTLSDGNAPLRPHMAYAKDSRKEANDVASEAAAAASDVAGEIISAPVHAHLSNGPGAADELERLKGVGPKFADALRAHGYLRFEQLARLTPEEIERLDNDLGPFRGRVRRDRLAEQAAFLARGDVDGFEQNFGKL